MLVRSLRAVCVATLLTTLCPSLGCTPSLEQRAAKSLASGTDALQKMYRTEAGQKRAFQSGTLWMTHKLTEYTGDGRYAGWVEEVVGFSSNDRALRLVDPSLPKPVLPADPGRGFERFGNFVLAPMGQPELLARKYVLELISEAGEGYVLTHQILVIAWAREQGLTLPPSAENRKQQMLRALKKSKMPTRNSPICTRSVRPFSSSMATHRPKNGDLDRLDRRCSEEGRHLAAVWPNGRL